MPVPQVLPGLIPADRLQVSLLHIIDHFVGYPLYLRADSCEALRR